MKRRRYATTVLALIALACVSCGQKPGVALLPDPRASLGGGLVLPEGASVDPETGQIVDSAGNVIGSVGDLAAGSASADLASSGGPVAGSQSDPAADALQSDGTAPPAAPADEKSVGAGGLIKIGAHAPLTGAAPVPSDSAEKGNDLYYKWLKEQGKDINGRQVEALLRNDNYNPSQAVAVCKELVEKDHVFMLVGAAGTDQIQACARYANSQAHLGDPHRHVGDPDGIRVARTGLYLIRPGSSNEHEHVVLLDQLLAHRDGLRGVVVVVPNYHFDVAPEDRFARVLDPSEVEVFSLVEGVARDRCRSR